MNNRALSHLVCLLLLFVGAACTAAPTPVAIAPTTDPAVTPASVVDSPVIIAGPATPSSIPLILAAEKLENTTVQIYQNNAQANTSFLRGEINILATGLSVGVDLRKNEAPVQALNTYVTGLSYLVTYGTAMDSLSDLKGGEIYLPFEGSPIEEATIYLPQQEGLTWGVDLKPVYSPFDASVVLLKEGKAKAVVLPEPFVTLVESEPNLFISLDYYEHWNAATHTQAGYPQVGSFVTAEWAAQNSAQVAAFNSALTEAIQFVKDHPEEAVAKVKDQFNLPEAVLLRSLQRTHFSLLAGEALQTGVTEYYEWIGKPLNDIFTDFTFIPEK